MLYDTFAGLDRELTRLGSMLPALASQGWRAPMDVRRETDRYVVDMDLPGVDPSSIDITVEDGWLTVKAERSRAREVTEDAWVVRERSHQAVVRRFGVGEAVDADAITADYTDGVLTLSLPLAEHAKPRKVVLSEGTTARGLGAGSSDGQGKGETAHSVTS